MAKQSNCISCAYGSGFTAMKVWYVSKGLISDDALYVNCIGQYFMAINPRQKGVIF